MSRFIHLSVLTTIAVAFCYFETLLRTGNRQKFLEEEVRIKSLSNLIKELGFDEMLYEDFVEDTLNLLRLTSRSTDGGARLVATFNDYSESQSVITCFKVGPILEYLIGQMLNITAGHIGLDE
jgi:ubiquitin thioesterase protein OTUB1